MIPSINAQTLIGGSVLVLAAGLALGLIALLRFREHSSRLLVIDLMGLGSIGLMAAWAILAEQSFWIDVALLFVLLGIVGTLALARYLNQESGEDS